MTNETKARLDAMLADNAVVRVSEVKSSLKLKESVTSLAESFKDEGYNVQKWGRLMVVINLTAMKATVQEYKAQGLTSEEIAEAIATSFKVSTFNTRYMVQKLLAELDTDGKANTKCPRGIVAIITEMPELNDKQVIAEPVPKPEPILTEAELNVMYAIRETLDDTAQEGKSVHLKNLKDILAAVLPDSKSQKRVLNQLLIQDDARAETDENGLPTYRGRQWYTAEAIAKRLIIPLKDVYNALYEMLHEPENKMRRRATETLDFEYSAWPNIFDVVREFCKARDRPKQSIAQTTKQEAIA